MLSEHEVRDPRREYYAAMQRKDHRNQEDRKEEVTNTRDLEGWIDRTWQKMVSCDKDCGIHPT